jgi:site-specific DNA recombinase
VATAKITYRSGDLGLTYLRVSSRGQVETEYDPEGMSLPAQRRKCAERVKESGVQIVDELIDSGLTATTIDQRESYRNLIERVQADRSISYVMVYSLSRLHRNWAEAGLMVLQLRSHGVRLLSATENIDDRTPEGQMMLGIIFAVSGFQSAASSKDLQHKMAQKAIIGGTPGYVPPGYVNVPEKFEGRTVNTVALDPERAPFIPLAFEWFATGQYTYDQLQALLTEAGFRSRPNRRYPARPVSRHTVEAMLRNRYYLGYVKWNGSEYQGRHQPLVSQELFDRVQHVLANMPGAGNRQRRYHHYLKGIVACQRCGRRLIVTRGKSKTGELYFYYVCRGRQDSLCDLPYVRVAHVEQAVANHYRSVSLPRALRDKLAAGFDEAVSQRHGRKDNLETRLRARLAEIDRQEDRYIDLATDPDWPKAKLTQKIRELRDERARLQSRLTEATKHIDQGQETARRLLAYLDNPYELYRQSGVGDRAKLNRLLFKQLKLDITDGHPALVTDDELLEPFASVIYLRRQLDADAAESEARVYLRETGSVPEGNPAGDGQLLSLLEQALGTAKPLKGSSKDTLAEDRVSEF